MSPSVKFPVATSVCLLVCGLCAPVVAQDKSKLTGEKIVRRTDKDHKAKDESGVVDMVLVAKDGKKKRRSMEMLFLQGKGDDDKHRLRFLTPPTVRGLALLTVEATGRSDDQWVFLPRFKKSKKIASSSRTQRFAQTDFTYEDLRTEDFANTTYKRLDDSTINKVPVYVVEAKAKNADLSGYSKRVLYVEKARFLTLQVKFYSKKKKLQKTLINRDFKKHEGLLRPTMAKMEDHQRGTKTIWKFTKRQINKGLPDSRFSPKALERGT